MTNAKRDSNGRFAQKYFKPNKCKDCNKEISRYALSCRSCCRKAFRYTKESRLKMSNSRKGRFKGENHPRWKGEGGYITSDGYKMLWFRKGGKTHYLLEQHYEWMNANGFWYIPDGFVIHHRDLDKLNNKPSNLLLLPRNFHNKLHWQYERENNIDRFGGIKNV